MFTYFSPSGEEWNLSDETHGVFIQEKGLRDISPALEQRAVSSQIVHGQRFTGVHAHPIEGQLVVMITPGEDVMERAMRFRRAWSHTLPGVLRIDAPDIGAVSTQVRLRGALPDFPYLEDQAIDIGYPDTIISFIADSGAWWTDWSEATDSVTVTNNGDVPVRPHIVWEGRGGRVVMPSGASFTLPAASSTRRLVLDNAQSCVVMDEHGEIDTTLWRQLAPIVMPEGVPPQSEHTYQLPAGARLAWRLGYFSPLG